MSQTLEEIASQPRLWRRALEVDASPLPRDGESLAVVGCGTSWFIAQAYTTAREREGKGPGDAFTATEFPWDRHYDRVICLSRSGTTTEVVDVLRRLAERGTPGLLVTAVGGGPASPFASAEVVLGFADEESVVQTRFATSALAYFRASLGHDIAAAAADAEFALDAELPQRWVDADQIAFLGTGWTIGLANEAGLKLREASQSWTEAYPAMEYRHGPISIAQPGRLTWVFGPVPEGLGEEVAATGAELVSSQWDPMAHLVLAQRLAVVTGLGLLDGLFGGHQGSVGIHHEAYRADAGAWCMLGQPGNAQPGQVDVALFGGEIAAQQCQQRALAAAVGADEGYALTRVDDERGVGKEGAPGAGQAEVVEADQGRARSVSGRQKAGPGWPASP